MGTQPEQPSLRGHPAWQVAALAPLVERIRAEAGEPVQEPGRSR